MEPELRMSDFAAAADTSRGARRLWLVVCRVGTEDEHEAVLAVARSPKEARLFAAAARWDADDGTEAEAGWKAEEAPKSIELPPCIIGVWAAPDAVWAECGVVPNEDWQHCGCCDQVVHADGWALEGDDCDACSGVPDAQR